ncbi:hypothetical protein CK203_020108 [Vitis vinifera]|uniref:Uncharacterized protein n=1 Tax=Vitis vinifera TaxID=29760 RepID=A0A438J8B5_VITVI|nr:hypothetical protein CK203_020108 [Vitis vinifera]
MTFPNPGIRETPQNFLNPKCYFHWNLKNQEAQVARSVLCITGLCKLMLLDVEGCHVTTSCLDSLSGLLYLKCIILFMILKILHLI